METSFEYLCAGYASVFTLLSLQHRCLVLKSTCLCILLYVTHTDTEPDLRPTRWSGRKYRTEGEPITSCENKTANISEVLTSVTHVWNKLRLLWHHVKCGKQISSADVTWVSVCQWEDLTLDIFYEEQSGYRSAHAGLKQGWLERLEVAPRCERKSEWCLFTVMEWIPFLGVFPGQVLCKL